MKAAKHTHRRQDFVQDSEGHEFEVPCEPTEIDEVDILISEDGSKPSAHSSLLLSHGDDEGECLSECLVDAKFEADTPEEVMAQVEDWAQKQMDKAVEALRAAFAKE